MHERLIALLPTLLEMSAGSQFCLIAGLAITASCIWLMSSPWFEEGVLGRLVLGALALAPMVSWIEIYVAAGRYIFEFSPGTVVLHGATMLTMLWLVATTFVDRTRARKQGDLNRSPVNTRRSHANALHILGHRDHNNA